MPGSRMTANGAITRRCASGGTIGPCGRSSAKTTAVTAVSTPAPPSARPTPPTCTASGSSSAASSPPSATDICRMPSAKPRRSGGKPWNTETVAATATTAPATPLAKSAMPSPTGIRQRRPGDQQQPAGGARDEQRSPRPGAIDDDARRDQRDGVAERGRVDERAEARRARGRSGAADRADHAEAPLHDRDRRLAGERQDEQPARDRGRRSLVVERRGFEQRRAEQPPGELRILVRCGELAQHGRGARQVRARRARQIAANRIRQRAAPLAGAQLVGERRHGSRIGGAERVARDRRPRPRAAASAAPRRAARPRRCRPSRAGARAAAGRPGWPTRSRDTRRARGRCHEARSRMRTAS